MLFGSLGLDCGDRGGVSYWAHGSEMGEGRNERIEVGLVDGMETGGRRGLLGVGEGVEGKCER